MTGSRNRTDQLPAAAGGGHQGATGSLEFQPQGLHHGNPTPLFNQTLVQ